MTAECRLLLLVTILALASSPGLALSSDPVAEHYIIRRGPGPQATTFLSNEKRPRSAAQEPEDGGVIRRIEDMGKLLDSSVTIRPPASVMEAAFLVGLSLLSLYILGQILAFVLSGLFNLKLGLARWWWDAVTSPLLGSLASLVYPGGDGRRQRAIEDISGVVYKAIDLYTNTYTD